MEYCAAGSITDIMKVCLVTITESQIASICKDTLQGLQYLHDSRKLHRDIKAGNILLTQKGVAKLGKQQAAENFTRRSNPNDPC
jgi:serine/threonine kinase 3